MLHLHCFLACAALCFQSAVFEQGNVNKLHVTQLIHSLIIKKFSITVIVCTRLKEYSELNACLSAVNQQHVRSVWYLTLHIFSLCKW